MMRLLLGSVELLGWFAAVASFEGFFLLAALGVWGVGS